MILETVVVSDYQVNCYILASGTNSQAIIIDPGAQEQKIKKILHKFGLTPAFIINTHGHIDHIGCDDAFGVPVYIHRDDARLLKDPNLNLSSFLSSPLMLKSQIKELADRETITLDEIELQVIHVPGHTQGSISLLLKKPKTNIVFTGDTLFYQGVGRTDFPGADTDALLESIREKLFILPDETLVLPGHGPSSSIGEEKKSNPYARIH